VGGIGRGGLDEVGREMKGGFDRLKAGGNFIEPVRWQ
jgi:hypothetical protein